MENNVYCIYSGKYIPDSQSSLEHIVPLSLGGSDDFTIMVDRNLNSIAGSSIDGKISNDFLVKMNTIKKDYRGHSKKEPVLKIKKAKLEDSPVSVHFKKSGMEIYDPIKKRLVTESAKVQLEMKIDLYARIRFVSKVALAAGYFTYKDIFVKYADHDSLRKIAFSKGIADEHLSGIKFYDNLHSVKEEDKGLHLTLKNLIKSSGSSCVIFVLSNINIIAYVGVGGEYIGTVNFKANTKKFPNDKGYRLGRVLVCNNNQLVADSFWHAIYQFNKVHRLVDIDDSVLEF
ncbi:hypothetical protein [Neobacillus drentensis]|uniref:hypothetical protein n=1 Tax=Neobacillus drentensis TaxID=220684 RepID=UPI002FFECAD7